MEAHTGLFHKLGKVLSYAVYHISNDVFCLRFCCLTYPQALGHEELRIWAMGRSRQSSCLAAYGLSSCQSFPSLLGLCGKCYNTVRKCKHNVMNYTLDSGVCTHSLGCVTLCLDICVMFGAFLLQLSSYLPLNQ